HFHRRIAVFERVVFCHRAIRQLALLAHRYETEIQLVGQHRAQDEAARIHAGHQIEPLAHIAVYEYVDQDAEGTRVLQDGGDIPESDTRLGPVRHAADRVADIDGWIDMHGEPVKGESDDNCRSVHNADYNPHMDQTTNEGYARHLASARRTFSTEIQGLQALQDRLDERFGQAVEMLLGCHGRVVVTGIGKSGH